jgi:hypothetical protein
VTIAYLVMAELLKTFLFERLHRPAAHRSRQRAYRA